MTVLQLRQSREQTLENGPTSILLSWPLQGAMAFDSSILQTPLIYKLLCDEYSISTSYKTNACSAFTIFSTSNKPSCAALILGLTSITNTIYIRNGAVDVTHPCDCRFATQESFLIYSVQATACECSLPPPACHPYGKKITSLHVAQNNMVLL